MKLSKFVHILVFFFKLEWLILYLAKINLNFIKAFPQSYQYKKNTFKKKVSFELVPVSQIIQNIQKPNWLIKDVCELDSVIARDVSKQHFCCGITCNGKPMLFDGSAFSRLVSRNWKSWLNKNYNWTVGKIGPQWNFKQGYSMLFYYRST